MSEHITHVSLADDGRRLASVTPGLPAEFLAVWQANPEMARAGGCTRKADLFSADIIAGVSDDVKAAHAAGELGDATFPGRDNRTSHVGGAKLAFVLGALTHRAADRLMKPVFHYFQGLDDYPGFNRCTIFHDIYVLKHVLNALPQPPYPEDMLRGEGTPAEHAFDNALRGAVGRTLIGLHTLIPDTDHVHQWLENLRQVTLDYGIRVDEYRRIYTDWPEDEVKRYIDDTHFYDESDDVLQVLKTLRAGGSVSEADAQQAVANTTDASSRYARAVAQANGYLRAAGDLFDGKATVEETKPKLDIGVPELSIPFEPK